MSFFFPAAFFLSLLGVGIVALYLRRNRRRLLEVSSTLFWRRILDRQPNRRFLGRLRQPLSLLLQLLIFALLLLALARPEFDRLPGQRSTVIVLDTRARMQAGSAFSQALAAARQLASQAGADDEIAILTLGGEAMVLSPFTSRSKELWDRLATVQPTDGGGEAGPVLALAEKLLSSRPEPRRLVVITDRTMFLPEGADLVLTGQPLENSAILELAPRPLPASPQTTEVFLKIGNFSATPKDIEVELLLDDRPIDLQTLKIPAGEQANFLTRLPAASLSGEGKLTARLTAPDAFPVDNEARAILESAQPIRVLLVTKGNPFLENAIRADPAVAMEILSPDQWRSSMSSGFDVTVFDDVAIQEPLEGINTLFFGRSPFEAGGEPIPVIAPETLVIQHPLLWNVTLAKARYATANRLDLARTDGWKTEIVATNAGEPFLLALEKSPAQRAVVAAWSAAGSNLALKTDFPLFINNALHWLAGRSREGGSSQRAGETYASAGGGRVFLGRNGFREIEPSKWLAVNTSDMAESDLRASQSNSAVVLSLARFAVLQPWQWLALVALLLILLEWWLHHRRITE